MGKVANRLARIRKGMGAHLQDGLEDVASDAETIAKFVSANHWENDTGSATSSITGWNPERSSHDKNFNDPDWIDARTGRTVSRYGNPPENYRPDVNQTNRDEDYESYLSMFVWYGPEIQSISDDSGVMLFQEVMDMMPGTMLKIITRQIERGLRS